MADIARLGFSADTGDLKNAKAALDALVPSAAKAEKATDRFNRAAAGVTTGASGAATGIKSFQSAAMGASSGVDRLSKAALASGTAMGTVQRAAIGANAQMSNLVATTARIGTTFAQADAHVIAYRNSLNSVAPAAQGAKTALDRLGASANDNINRLQSTPGNIAAQFQDIGVTAAGGMSPLLIALQQGTQLSSAFAGGFKDLLAGFAQIFSPVTLLTILIVGLVAAGLQAVDWMSLAQTLLYGLADAVETCSTAVAYLGVVLAIAFAPKIVTTIASMTAAIAVGLVGAVKSATVAMIAFSLANPFTAIVLAIGLVIGAMVMLNDTFGGVFTNILSMVKTVANAIISFLVNAFNVVVLRIQGMINAAADGINSLAAMVGLDMRVGKVDFSSAIVDTNGRDFVGEAVDLAKGFGSWAGGKMRGFADGIGAGDPDKKKDRASRAARGEKSEAEKQAEAYADLVKGAQQRIESLRVESAALDMSARAGNLYRAEQDLIAQATDKGIKLTADQITELKGLAAQMTDMEGNVAFKNMLADIEKQMRALKDEASVIGLVGFELERATILQELMNDAVDKGIIDLNNMTDAMRLQVAMLENRATALAQQSDNNKALKFVTDLTKAHEDEMWALGRERDELGLTGAALEAYRMETDLINDAKRQSIALTPEILAQIRQQSSEYALATEEIRKQREAIEFQRDTFKGFFTDMLDGLRQGQSVWEAFGNAVMRVVDRIIDRLLDQQLDGLLNSILNLTGTVVGGIGGGAGKGANSSGGIKAISKNALGNAFDAGGITPFAKGGAFTNGVYSSPTLFRFAKGAALGQMGEAGPEAVMPLKRGPDGSLGVQMHGGQQAMRVEIGVNDDRFNAYVDDRADGAVVRGAPAIASAGADVAQNRTAFTNTRRLR